MLNRDNADNAHITLDVKSFVKMGVSDEPLIVKTKAADLASGRANFFNADVVVAATVVLWGDDVSG